MLELHPLAYDLEGAVRLVRPALAASAVAGETIERRAGRIEDAVRAGAAQGLVAGPAHAAVGLALWDDGHLLGRSLELLYLEPTACSYAAYVQLLDAATPTDRALVFAPAHFAGLPDDRVAQLLRSRGFARWGREEMQYPADRPPPAPLVPDGTAWATARADDAEELAGLHARAYAGELDRYLLMTDRDPVADARVLVRQLFEGRWGEFLEYASPVGRVGPSIVAACLVTRTEEGALLADVMADPAHRGRGLGGAAVRASVAALRARGETAIYLNVTLGNAAATRTYERAGFVRTIGPWWGFYSTRAIPVPEPVYPEAAVASGSAADRVR